MSLPYSLLYIFFFFNDTATTEIYTLSLHDALPISYVGERAPLLEKSLHKAREDEEHGDAEHRVVHVNARRSEEHTSELQSRSDLVCRLLLEKKKKTRYLCPNWHVK